MGEDAQRVSLRVVERKPGPINGQDMLEGLADRVEEPFLGQILYEGIVDLKKRAIALCACRGFRIRLRTVHGAYLFERSSHCVSCARDVCRPDVRVYCHILAQESSQVLRRHQSPQLDSSARKLVTCESGPPRETVPGES